MGGWSFWAVCDRQKNCGHSLPSLHPLDQRCGRVPSLAPMGKEWPEESISEKLVR